MNVNYFYPDFEKRFTEEFNRQQKEMSKMAKISMTRKEAENKLYEAKIPRDIKSRYQIIDVLEALGLLHILPPEPEELPAIELYVANSNSSIKIWANGRTEGLTGKVLINRIPQILMSK